MCGLIPTKVWNEICIMNISLYLFSARIAFSNHVQFSV